MKPKIKLAAIILFTGIAAAFTQVKAQDSVYSKKVYTYTEMKTNWSNFSTDPGWKTVISDLRAKGWELINHEKTMWGMEGYVIDSLTRTKQRVVFCAFDFGKKGYNAFASAVWLKRGEKMYKASIVFPSAEKDVETAFLNSVELYVDPFNKLQKANSFGRCWRRESRKDCPSFCLSSITTCATAAATLAAAGLGITTPVAIGIFAGCAGFGCVGCLAVQAIQCL